MTLPGRALTSFVGRFDALSEAQDLLGRSRLVTLTGTGGVGKTRLALELADRTTRAFPDGVTVVELATLDVGAEVAAATAAALGVPDQSTRRPVDRVVRHLAGREMLLVVDNCEHVLDAAAALVGELLASVAGLRVLATSREPLGLAGEQMFPVPPLGLPAAAADDRDIAASEAVHLLVDRARQYSPDFTITDDNRRDVVELCTRLDGMPLAIELAAARLRSLSVAQIVDRLDERFLLLTGGTRDELPRHRTLWDLVDWSHDLCSSEERLLWARLAVFPGGFDLEAAEAVGGDGELAATSVLDVLDRLVAKSIVLSEQAGKGMRYRMLVTMREYGAHRLDERGERDQVRRRHRNHYLARASEMVAHWCGPGQPDALAAMRRDHANLLAALEWSTTTPGEVEQAAELASLLRYHWIAGGFLSDGRRWLERILELDDAPTAHRGAALSVAAWVALIQGDRAVAAAHLRACRSVADSIGDEVLRGHVDLWTALRQLFSGELDAAVASYRRAIAVLEPAGDVASVEIALFQLAMAQTYRREPGEALTTCDRVLALSDQRGEQWCRAYSLWVTGISHWHQGDLAAARDAAVAALELQREFRDGICIALTLELLSWIACSEDDPAGAAALHGGAAAVWASLGTAIEAFGPHITEDGRMMDAQIAERMGAEQVAAARSEHRHLDRRGAVELGLASGRTPEPAEPVPGPLTRRERQVADLIASGLSNKAIAERLVISNRTVEGHVERILAKLGFASRTQVAAWAATRGVGTQG